MVNKTKMAGNDLLRMTHSFTTTSRFSLLTICLLLCAPDSSLLADTQGKRLYEQKCSQCHGMEGRGDGIAAPFVKPKPRDFTLGTYKIRTTPSGILPTDEDLFKTIARGIPGTSMPAFENSLSKSEIKEVVSYIQSFFPKFQEVKPEKIRIGNAPRSSQETIKKGEELYNKFRCFECHGTQGRGDGPSSPTLKDEKGDAILAADLTKSWNFRGGGTVEDIFTRLTTGLSGSPMPSFLGIFPDEKEDEQARWALAHYIKSLSQGHPNFKSVIPVEYLNGEIPRSFDDPIWKKAEEIDIPLVGQVLVEPRLFNPSIDFVSVSALYNDQEMVMKIRWNDRTDPSKIPETKGAEIFPDSLSIQFPLEQTSDSELPYFLGGDETKPVQLLTWFSNFDRMSVFISRGLLSLENLSTTIESKAIFEQGQWTLSVSLPLSSPNRPELSFKTGEFVPIAFYAGDGSCGESGIKRSVSAWVHLLLKQPPSKKRFLWPLLVFVGMISGEIFLLRWAHRKPLEKERS